MYRSLVVALALSLSGLVRPATAQQIYVPLEDYVHRADLVVVAKLTHDRMGYRVPGIARVDFHFGDLDIRETLKGPHRRTVTLAYLPSSTHLSDVTTYQEGQDGIWMLFPDPYHAGVYRVDGGYVPVDERHQVEAALVEEHSRHYGESVNGLAAYVEGMKPTFTAKEPILLRFGLRNASRQDMAIVDNLSAHPLMVTLIAKHWMTTTFDPRRDEVGQSGLGPLTGILKAGQSTPTVLIPFHELRLPPQKPGTYRVALTYRNDTDPAIDQDPHIRPWKGKIMAVTSVVVR